MISVKECIESEVRNMQHYIANSEEELLQFVVNSMQIDPASVEEKNNFQKRLIDQKIDSFKGMKLHGQFENQTAETKTEESWNWLSKETSKEKRSHY